MAQRQATHSVHTEGNRLINSKLRVDNIPWRWEIRLREKQGGRLLSHWINVYEFALGDSGLCLYQCYRFQSVYQYQKLLSEPENSLKLALSCETFGPFITEANKKTDKNPKKILVKPRLQRQTFSRANWKRPTLLFRSTSHAGHLLLFDVPVWSDFQKSQWRISLHGYITVQVSEKYGWINPSNYL